MKEETHHIGILLLFIFLIVLIIAISVYILAAQFFRTHFFPHTTVNGTDFSLQTAEDLLQKNEERAADYVLSIYGRDGNLSYIKGSDFAYSYVSAGEEETLPAKQDASRWIFSFLKEHNYKIDAAYTFDEEALEEVLLALPLFTDTDGDAPTDAYLSRTKDGLYEIVPETYGNTLLTDAALSEIKEAVSEGLSEWTLSDDCYKAPKVLSDSPVLTEALLTIDTYCSAAITYTVPENEIILDAAQIGDMLTVSDDYTVSINEEAVTSFVQTLATAYNTYGDVRSFTTTQGDVVEIGGGDYGWVVSKSGEFSQILQDLSNGMPVTREPVYEQTAKQSGSDDIGGTYLELDYSNQHLYYYEDGVLILDCDIVSGKMKNGNGSPDGVYKIVYKEQDTVLVGEDYASPVSYFMPFAYNVGVHDADWRSSFGGSIYQNFGSHGCVNIPYEAAEQLYETIEVGTPVVAYYRQKVTLTSESSRISNAYSYAG